MECNYLNELNLPNIAIEPLGQASDAFLQKNIFTLWDAIHYINNLSYGRNTNRANYWQVLDEKTGSCSTKHALIAKLAEELSVPLKLTLGIFLLTTKHTPKIATILETYKLQAIPEAHCYLKYGKEILDITFSESPQFSFNRDLQQEFYISPQQIGSFKIEIHQIFIKNWIKDKPHLNFDLVWRAREQWIKMLSDN